MYFIAVGTDVRPEEFGPFMVEEAAVLAELRAQGTVKSVFKRVAGGGVYTIVEAPTADEALRQLERLPLVREGLLAFELTEVVEL
jgi:muconolactone delta-isomerase